MRSRGVTLSGGSLFAESTSDPTREVGSLTMGGSAVLFLPELPPARARARLASTGSVGRKASISRRALASARAALRLPSPLPLFAATPSPSTCGGENTARSEMKSQMNFCSPSRLSSPPASSAPTPVPVPLVLRLPRACCDSFISPQAASTTAFCIACHLSAAYPPSSRMTGVRDLSLRICPRATQSALSSAAILTQIAFLLPLP
mmetsp:Transcript_23786/g.60234  ORF Transcript_23786/g.60234 Transcript_23786/m.60234 type:complete len:205 (+) Transcript_23786:1148-1762(+)